MNNTDNENENETTKHVEENKLTTSPFEKLFDIPSGSTEMKVVKPVTESTAVEAYDSKDIELERQLDAVKDMAQFAFENIQDNLKDVEPKYSARLNEVANSFLTTMVDALKVKTKIKIEKDKIVNKTNTPKVVSSVTHNTIVGNTSDIIDKFKKGEIDVIDGEYVSMTKDNDDE